MEPVSSQGVSSQAVESFSFHACLASWYGHIVSETAKAFVHIQNSVLQFFNEPKRQVTPISRLPSALVATGIVRMLTVKDASGFFDFLCYDERLALLNEPRIINKLVRAYSGDLDAIPAVWKKALVAVGPAVRSLDLHGIKLRPIYVKKIVQLFPNLKELNLEKCALTDQCIYYLRNTKLETLKFDKNKKITEFGIDWLSRLAAAKTIDLPSFTYHEDLLSIFLEEISGRRIIWHPLPKTLEQLTVDCNKYHLRCSLKQFLSLLKEHCPNIKTMNIRKTYIYTQEAIDGLKALTTLETLRADLDSLSDSQISALTSLVNLKTLEIKDSYNLNVTNAIFNSLATLKELECLILNGFMKVTAEGIDKLSVLPNLRSLTLSSMRLNNNGLNAIAKLRGLHILDFSNCEFSERTRPNTMHALCNMPELHTLSITTRTRNPFFPHTGLEKLQRLKIVPYMPMRDNELASLQEMPELLELEITNCKRLTDQTLTTLVACKKLKKVKLTESNFTAAGLANFKLARPDIELTN